MINALLDPRLRLLSLQTWQVTVEIVEPLATAERGHLLLETERLLRSQIDPQIEVFLQPKGDMNKLRERLRGVGLK